MCIRRIGSARMDSSSDVADLGGADSNTLHVILPEQTKIGLGLEPDPLNACRGYSTHYSYGIQSLSVVLASMNDLGYSTPDRSLISLHLCLVSELFLYFILVDLSRRVEDNSQETKQGSENTSCHRTDSFWSPTLNISSTLGIHQSTYHFEWERPIWLTREIGGTHLSDYITGSGHLPVVAVISHDLWNLVNSLLHLLGSLNEDSCQSRRHVPVDLSDQLMP